MAIAIALVVPAVLVAWAVVRGRDDPTTAPSPPANRSEPVVVDGLEYVLEIDPPTIESGADAEASVVLTNVGDEPAPFPPTDGRCVEKLGVGLVEDPDEVPDVLFTADCRVPGDDRLAPGSTERVALTVSAVEPVGAAELPPGTYHARVVGSAGGVYSDPLPVDVV